MSQPVSEDATEDLFRQERQRDREYARAFVDAVESGNAAALFVAVDGLNDMTVDGWRLAMRGVARLKATNQEIKEAFLTVCVESKSVAVNAGRKLTHRWSAAKLHYSFFAADWTPWAASSKIRARWPKLVFELRAD